MYSGWAVPNIKKVEEGIKTPIHIFAQWPPPFLSIYSERPTGAPGGYEQGSTERG